MLLKNKPLIFIILIILFSSIVISVPMCQVSQVETSLKRAVYNFLTNPQEAALSLNQIKKLIIFYLEIPEDAVTVNCSQISAIMGEIEENISINLICSDGTEYGECSTQKPKYCYAGTLIDRCDICGCDGYLCDNATGLCTEQSITCSVDSDCGTNNYTGNNYCSENDIYRNYITFTCNNPNTADSYCTNKTTPILIETCQFGCADGDGACVAESNIIFIDSCQPLDEPNKYYKLNQSITTTETCFTIEKDGITLDLNDYNITGDKEKNDYGISLLYHTGVTVKNGEIYKFGTGIIVYGSYNTIEDITANSNNENGIFISTSNSTLRGITANSNGGAGIFVGGYGSGNNILTDITANSNYDGIRIDLFSNNNRVTDAIAHSNGWYGIKIGLGSAYNIVTGSNFCDNNINCHPFCRGDIDWYPPLTFTNNYCTYSGGGVWWNGTTWNITCLSCT